MGIVYARLADPVDMAGNPVEIAWRATDEATGYEIMRTFPLGTSDAAAEAALAAAFPAIPPIQNAVVPLNAFVNKATGEVFLLDGAGKAMFSLMREADGGTTIKGIDAAGNAVNYTRSQVVTLVFRGTKIATASWPRPFVRIPSVSLTLTDASAQPPYRLAASKTQVTVRFGSAYTGSVEVHANER